MVEKLVGPLDVRCDSMLKFARGRLGEHSKREYNYYGVVGEAVDNPPSVFVVETWSKQ